MAFNLAEFICRKHTHAAYRVAIEERRESGSNLYTYGGLDYLSDKFSNVLQQSGVKQGDVIAVILPASAAFVVANFAALKLGAIVAPLPPELPLGLLESLRNELQLNAIVLTESLFEEAQSQIALIDGVESFIASDYVSRKEFGKQGRGFWRSINDADDEFKLADTSATTPAYEFLEMLGSTHTTRTFFTHGLIYDGLCETETAGELDVGDSEPVPSESDWFKRDVLFEELYPVWYSGGSIRMTM